MATLSIRAAAKDFGVSAQALLSHFGSKKELVQQVLHRAVYQDVLVLEGLLNNMSSVREMVDKLLRELMRPSFRRMFAIQVELFATAAIDPRRYGNFATRATERAHETFAIQARRDGLPDERIELISSFVLTGLRGIVMEALGGREIEKLRQVADELVEWYEANLKSVANR